VTLLVIEEEELWPDFTLVAPEKAPHQDPVEIPEDLVEEYNEARVRFLAARNRLKPFAGLA
jgi:hypothetical protein